MWTAAKLVAAILFAGLAFYVSQLIRPLFPEGTNLGWFAEVNAVIGYFSGWVIAGSRAGQGGWPAAVSYGLTATVGMTFWCLVIHSGVVMIEKSMMRLYDGPGEAIVAFFGLLVDHLFLMSTPEVLIVLFGGGVVAALVTEVAGRNFR
jgi:hypothetical protein